jgi:hypothetical protein
LGLDTFAPKPECDRFTLGKWLSCKWPKWWNTETKPLLLYGKSSCRTTKMDGIDVGERVFQWSKLGVVNLADTLVE